MALVSVTYPFAGTDNWDYAEFSSGHRGRIKHNSLMDFTLVHVPLPE